MHIALIRQKYTPYGGAERFVSNALSALAQDNSTDLHVSLISRQWQDDQTAALPLTWIQCDPFYFPKMSVFREISFAKGVHEILDKTSFDIVQTHERIVGCDIFRAGDGVHATWLEARAQIASPLDQWRMGLNPLHHYLLKTEKQLFADPRLQYVICNSEMVKKDIMTRFHLPSEKLPVIYNGYHPDQFSPTLIDQYQKKTREALNIPLPAPVFLFVGSGFERKGLKQAIEAVSAQKDAYLIAVGYDKRMKDYQTFGDTLLGNRFRFMGPQKDVRPYYGAADALILPTLYDPLANVICEAMATSLPVITTTGCGGQDFIKNGETGFICHATDIPALQQAVHALSDRAFARQCGHRARALIEPLTVSTMTDKLTTLYRQLMHSRNHRP